MVAVRTPTNLSVERDLRFIDVKLSCMSGLLVSHSSGLVQEHRKIRLLEIRFDVRVTVHP